MAKSEYSRLRDIAQKRLGRLESAGLSVPGLSFPKMRDLKTPEAKERALEQVKQFVSGETTVKAVRESGKIIAPGKKGFESVDPKVQARRERQRLTRQARREALGKLTKEQRSMIKGAKKLGIKVATSDIPAFVEYMEYRFSQYSDSRFYLFADYAEDFGKLKKSHGANSILADFNRFKAERDELTGDNDYSSYSASEFQSMWNDFIDSEEE